MHTLPLAGSFGLPGVPARDAHSPCGSALSLSLCRSLWRLVCRFLLLLVASCPVSSSGSPVQRMQLPRSQMQLDVSHTPSASFTRWYMTRLTCGPLLLEACRQGCVPVNILDHLQIPQSASWPRSDSLFWVRPANARSPSFLLTQCWRTCIALARATLLQTTLQALVQKCCRLATELIFTSTHHSQQAYSMKWRCTTCRRSRVLPYTSARTSITLR